MPVLPVLRQQLLLLCAATPNLMSPIVAWSMYDGTGRTTNMAGDSGDDARPPYDSVLAAMKDGWRVLQVPALAAPAPGREHETGFLRFEYVLEKIVDAGARVG